MQKVNVFWFRRDLRLIDNHGLSAALSDELPVLPIFIFDRNILDTLEDRKDRRLSYIYRALHDMHLNLQKAGSGLRIYYDKPEDAFTQILQQNEIHAVYCNHDYEPYAIQRDLAIERMLRSRGVLFKTFKDQVIFERSEVVKPDGQPYTVFTPYARSWKKKLAETGIPSYRVQNKTSNYLPCSPHEIPQLQEFGFESIEIYSAEYRLDGNILHAYESLRNYPHVNGTTHISTALRFGTVSIRSLVHNAQQESETWLNELIWREFFMMILYHFPRVVHSSFKPKYDRIQWLNRPEDFERWCKGETGIPLVDAGMRELNETGFMHNRVRMVTASFLCKHLLTDWRQGEAYFAKKLIDFELSSNNGNWQWAAGCGCDAAPYFRIFNPVEQARKFDPESLYIRKWIEPAKYTTITPIIDLNFGRQRALEVYRRAVGEDVM
ncbi:MAG: DNA photolyase family protein [Saprospiraceae bacterium]|nr:DNA photolyase family protein [Saprospiraceae bacterium]HMW38024.1 deoxyribodipyrimidine photo-lyase [Saprospiraceae bacterium]HMX86986.1 deoxyribodipyrimidine photo-lyase [Saprospiraceae bacterium]HMZ39835.1 deoxyribodipyrimidine photo-lyase [Saprospiraceae bacterium]HNA64304.1 deoxyribodipyrimidine photo-lyase [Saprospiraceae bacterium]